MSSLLTGLFRPVAWSVECLSNQVQAFLNYRHCHGSGHLPALELYLALEAKLVLTTASFVLAKRLTTRRVSSLSPSVSCLSCPQVTDSSLCMCMPFAPSQRHCLTQFIEEIPEKRIEFSSWPGEYYSLSSGVFNNSLPGEWFDVVMIPRCLLRLPLYVRCSLLQCYFCLCFSTQH